MRRFAWTLFALFFAWSLATTGQAAPKPLSFWAVTGSVDDVAMFRQVAKDFTRKTGIEVQVTPLNWGNFQTKYFTAMAAGLPPDIGITNLGGPFDYGAVGGLVDLREAFPEETAKLEASYYPGVTNIFEIGKKLYGVPNDLSTALVYYRTDIFQRLGLKPPRTWSELDEVILKLEGAGYHYEFGFPSRSQWAITMYTLPFGIGATSKGANGHIRVNWLEPKYLDGVAQALSFWYMHDSVGDDLGSRAVGLFADDQKGRAMPLFITLHGFYTQLQMLRPELEGKYDIVPWPHADGGKPYNVMGGTAAVIFRKSKMKKEAMQWLMYLNSTPALQYMMKNRLDRGESSALSVPPNREVWGPEWADFWKDPALASTRHLKDVMAEVVPTFGSVQSEHGMAEVGRLESNLLDQMGAWIRDEVTAIASSKGLSRWDLFQAWGQGRYSNERKDLLRRIRQRVAQQYGVIAPQAESILNKEAARYEARYGRIIEQLPEYERRADVMTVGKIVAAILFLMGAALVLVNKRAREKWISYVFVAAPLGLSLVFVFVPALVALYLSFTDYHPVLPLSTARWVAGSNYVDAFVGGDLVSALRRTATYVLGTMPIGILLALTIAILLNSGVRGERFWRFLVFSPLVTSVVSISLIFTQLYNSSTQGWLNALILGAGWAKDPVPFLRSEQTFMACVIALAVWHGLAFTTLIFLAGLQQIPRELYEAAAVDGASPARRHRVISLPGLKPQFIFVTVLGVIGGFQVFEPIYMLAHKSAEAGAKFGPNDSGMTMVPLIFHQGFETYEMGKSAAVAYVLFALIMILTLIQFKLYRRGSSS